MWETEMDGVSLTDVDVTGKGRDDVRAGAGT